jgi:hypothetical protein
VEDERCGKELERKRKRKREREPARLCSAHCRVACNRENWNRANWGQQKWGSGRGQSDIREVVDEQGAWALGKEFIAILRERPLPKMNGREGAMFTIYWGEVSADSDGPVEMCKPVPESDAKALASHYPELSLRTEPAHREAYVAIPNDALRAGPGGNPAVQWQLASEALRPWAVEHGIDPESPALKTEDLGVRITTSRLSRSLRRGRGSQPAPVLPQAGLTKANYDRRPVR